MEKAPGCIIGIVDGAFDQVLAITPREILACINAGCVVFGSSSMGALRAVELSSFGMRGVGRIFEMYQSGEVSSDDEVAIIFNPETGRPFTEPLVNVRCAVGEAVVEGVLKVDQAEAIVRATVDLPYWLRSYPLIIERAGELLGCTDLRPALNMLQQKNQKGKDALALIDAIVILLSERDQAAG